LEKHPSELRYAPQPAEKQAGRLISKQARHGYLAAWRMVEPPPGAGAVHDIWTRPEASSRSPVRLGTKK
jgi:hypothetical protein